MPFAATDVQIRLLRALEHLQCHGCDCGLKPDGPFNANIRLEAGVPESVVKAWVGVPNKEFSAAIASMKQRGFVKISRLPVWPIPGNMLRLFHPDGRAVIARHWRGDLDFLGRPPRIKDTPALRGKLRQAKTRRKVSSRMGYCVEVIVGRPRGSHLLNAMIFPSWHANDWGPAWLITEKGMDFLDHTAEPIDTLDELVTLNQISPLAGVSKRTLERWLRNRMVPRPDINGGGGTAHKWYWNNIRPHLEELVNRRLPTRFHGSRII